MFHLNNYVLKGVGTHFYQLASFRAIPCHSTDKCLLESLFNNSCHFSRDAFIKERYTAMAKRVAITLNFRVETLIKTNIYIMCVCENII